MDIETYQRKIREINPGIGGETSYRTALHNLFDSVDIPGKDIQVIQEARDEDVDGIPDFHVFEKENKTLNRLIGFVECKKIGTNLDPFIVSNQIAKYAKTTDNIIITDYKEFILLQSNNGGIKEKKRANLLDPNLLDSRPAPEQFQELYYEFINYDYPYINTKDRLIKELTKRSFYFSDQIREEVVRNEVFEKLFNNLRKKYSQMLHYEYSNELFSDIYAQSFVYGLLISRLEKESKYDERDVLNYINKYMPQTYKTLEEFLGKLLSQRLYLSQPFTIALQQVAKYVNLVHVVAIQEEFEKDSAGKNSIVTYLYEDFLKEFDKLRATENRKENGVYYTPKPVVDFITRNVDFLIKEKLGKPQGFNEEKVKVLDFATGTGSFLESVIKKMAEGSLDDLKRKKLKEKVLLDLYGFELQFAPYIVAHRVLKKALKNYDIELTEEEKLGIYIANTLDLDPLELPDDMHFLAQDMKKVQEIKEEEHILAIIGNPPYYNGKSPNKSLQMKILLKDYRKGLNETHDSLSDLYIEFIRFAEDKVDQKEEGIIGIITNNSFLGGGKKGKTHKIMRKHLFNTFDEIYILNLHGKLGEHGDENVFDIKVGVSISFFVKKKQKEGKKIWHYSILDADAFKRKQKFSFLEKNGIDTIEWQEITKHDDNLFFVPRDYEEVYSQFWKLPDIFGEYLSGPKSSKDKVAISYSKAEQEKKINDFINLTNSEIILRYKIKETENWTIAKAKEDTKRKNMESNYRRIHYRPFDIRWCFYTVEGKKGFWSRPQKNISRQFLNKNENNYALIFPRGVDNDFSHGFVSKYIIEHGAVGGGDRIAPLYCYHEGEQMGFDNYTINFKKEFAEFLKKLNFKSTSEEVFAYIYSILYSRIYRKEYRDHLQDDYPAIPFTKNRDIFYKYAVLGQKLVDLHLSEEELEDDDIEVKFDESKVKNFTIDKKISAPKGDNDTLILYGQGENVITFRGVSEEIYNFKIGTYRPIHNWLSNRKRDKVPLNTPDLIHIKNMIIRIKRTLGIMDEIEKLGEKYLTDI